MANKQDLINKVVEKTRLTKKETTTVVNAFLESITDCLKADDSVQLIGFGTFLIKERAERKARNPQTGEYIVIPAHKVPSFKAGKQLKDSVKE